MAKTIDLSELGETPIRSKKTAVTESKKKKKKSSKEKNVDETTKKKKKKKSSKDKVVKDKSKKKKSKSESKELVAESTDSKRDKKKKKLKAQASALEGKLEIMVQENPQIKEHDQFQEYVDIFNSLQDIARIKEEHCRTKNAQSRDIYALMQVYNQMRDVIADIRALKDITQVADDINQDVLEPFAQNSASILMDFYQNVEQLARKTLQQDEITPFVKQLKIYTKAAGVSMQEAYINSNNKTIDVLSEQ